MDDKMTKLFYGALLHDIGKAVQRTGRYGRKKHSAIGAEYLSAFTKDEEILNSVRYHHVPEIKSGKYYLREDSLSYITYIADNIASGTDRRSEDPDPTYKWDSEVPLSDIFNRYGKEKGQRYLHPGELRVDDLGSLIPEEQRHDYSKAYYARGVDYFGNSLAAVTLSDRYISSVLNLLEATMTFMPSSTNANEEADISLYDHMKLTAAYACALKQYLDFNKIEDYYHTLYRGSTKFYTKKAFTMVGFDMKGIQAFITTITSKGAHKQLRSRAFYVEMLVQNFLDNLLEKLNLSAANVLYANSGHGYLIIGNTSRNHEIVRESKKEFNNFLFKEFGPQLRLEIGMANFSSNQVREKNTSEQYVAIFREIDEVLARESQTPFNAFELMKLNLGQGDGRECAVCHNVTNILPDSNKCLFCEGLELFSNEVQKESFFVVTDEEIGLPLSDHDYLSVVSAEEIQAGNVRGHIYSKNQLNTGINQNRYLWVSDYSQTKNNDYGYYAQRSWTLDEKGKVQGIKRLGSLMIDIDDLYAGFLAGFHQQGEGHFTTMGRYATLSRRLELFVKLYVNYYAQEYHVSIIYSQGDDIFVLGAWDDLLDFVADLQAAFTTWTDGKLTFSAALGMFSAKTPINIIARQTSKLLSEAKIQGKNRLALYSVDNIFEFANFTENIIWDKLAKIRQFFAFESERGKSFIYKLLDLITQRKQGEKISFARLAYFLARLEGSSNNQDNFSKFKVNMMNWFESDQEIHELQVALMLYVYEIREDD